MPEPTNLNWPKYAAMGTVAALLLGALFWIFQVSITAAEAKQLATENRQTLKETLQSKADKNDVRELKQEIKDLNLQIRDLHEDLNASVFVKHSKR